MRLQVAGVMLKETAINVLATSSLVHGDSPSLPITGTVVVSRLLTGGVPLLPPSASTVLSCTTAAIEISLPCGDNSENETFSYSAPAHDRHKRDVGLTQTDGRFHRPRMRASSVAIFAQRKALEPRGKCANAATSTSARRRVTATAASAQNTR